MTLRHSQFSKGPVTNNMIINNHLVGNLGNAITAGGSAPHTSMEHSSIGNIFANNVAEDNLGYANMAL